MFKFFQIAKITRKGKGKRRRSNELTKAIAKKQAEMDMQKENIDLNFIKYGIRN